MYHLNSSLPAPYELNNSVNSNAMPSTELPAMAKGGRAKHKKVLAHFNRKELHVMDHLQGHTERCPKTGLRSYTHLEELLKNPHIVGTIHRHAHEHRQHHSMGGNIEKLSEGGRHGDTEMALIGPHTNHIFHQLAGRSTINPNTGHPEFWSLSGALGGLGSALRGGLNRLKPLAGSAANAIGQGARKLGSSALNAATAAAPHIGNAFNTLAPIAAQVGTQYLANKLQETPQEEEQFNPQEMVNMLPESMRGLGQAGLGAYDAYRGGATPQQAFGQGLSQYGQQYGGTLGNAMQGFGGALGQGQDYRSALGSAAGRVGQGYGGALGQGLQSAGQSFGRGQDLGQSFGQGLNTAYQGLGGRRGLVNSTANILRGYGAPGGMRGAAEREARGYMNRALPQYYPQEQESDYEYQYPEYGY